MNDSDRENLIGRTILLERIILGALFSGVMSFAFVASVVVRTNEEDDPNLPVLVVIGLMSMILAGLSQVVPRIMISRRRRTLSQSPDGATDEAILQIHLTALIVGSALLEAASFLLLICMLVTGVRFLLLPVALLMGLMLIKWPTAQRLGNWLEKQRDLLEQTF